jgi:hypothetical protein
MPDTDIFAPYYPTPSDLIPAWLGCLHWALGTPEIVASFREETGQRWTPGRTGLGQMVDRATGADAAFLTAFAAWMNENLWGTGEEPEKGMR